MSASFLRYGSERVTLGLWKVKKIQIFSMSFFCKPMLNRYLFYCPPVNMQFPRNLTVIITVNKSHQILTINATLLFFYVSLTIVLCAHQYILLYYLLETKSPDTYHKCYTSFLLCLLYCSKHILIQR